MNNNELTITISGVAGSGKTALALHLNKLLKTDGFFNTEVIETETSLKQIAVLSNLGKSIILHKKIRIESVQARHERSITE